MTLMSRMVLGLGGCLVISACSAGAEQVQPTTTLATTTTTTTTLVVEVVTTIRNVPDEELTSTGSITIGQVEYEFAFECFAAGAGDVLALGIGEDPETRALTQATVQMFLGQPYVSILIDGGRTLELAIDAPAELFLQSGSISGSALRFVEAGDGAGVGEEIGLGSVLVECSSFLPGLPEDYTTS